MRGGFANPRLANRLLPDGPGGRTRDASGDPAPSSTPPTPYAEPGVPLVVVAGREYGTGSSRDWAAKATALLGVRAVLAGASSASTASNLVQLGVLPVELATDRPRPPASPPPSTSSASRRARPPLGG